MSVNGSPARLIESGIEAAPKRRGSLRPLAALQPYVLRHSAMLTGALLALIGATAAALALPAVVRRMIDQGFSAADGGFLDSYFAIVIGVGAVLALASAVRFYCVTWLGERLAADLRADVFRHLTLLSPAFWERTHSAEIMSRLTADTTQIKAAAATAVSQALRNAVLLAGAVAMMVITSPRLSILALAVIPLIVLPLAAYGRAIRRLARQAQDELAKSSAYASENLSAARTMQAFTSEETVADRFTAAAAHAFQAAQAGAKARARLTAAAMFLVFASIAGILWYGAQSVLAGTMTGGLLAQFILYAVFAAGAVGGLSEVWGELQQAAGAAERLTELLAARPEVVSPEHPIDFPSHTRGEITFENVSFFYPSQPDSHALKNVSFIIRPGERVAIVGPSGAGKSTIFNLILRFYDVQGGRILLDRVPVQYASLPALRRRVALVAQETAIFADTVAENIRYGSPEASDEDVRRAAKTALANYFIEQLPNGYDTILGERGVTLSGGQRQRLAIARAVLRDAPILLLDEATSALDAESEKLVQTALDRVMQGRTTFIIAHRLATVLRASRILVLDDGGIAEEGTHESLVNNGGIYARLAELQFNTGAGQL